MRTLLSFLALLLTVSFAHAGKISKDCTYKGIPLYGKVYVKKSGGADFTVYAKKGGMVDLYVYMGNGTPNSCGKWKYTDNWATANFSIKYTDNWATADFFIKYTDNWAAAGLH